ncbi:MAG: tetratricopeptide repeat protein, partial [Planctomycetales bacterium]|nr:tetratricopeptide repeat protein [Planctomycetales bacterium]
GLAVSLGLIWREQQRTAVALSVAASRAAEARRSAAEAAAVEDFLVNGLLTAASPSTGIGREATVRQAIEIAEANVGAAFAAQPTVEAEVRHAIGQTYSALGENEKAESQLRRAVKLRETALGADHPHTLASRENLAQQLLLAGDRNAEGARLIQETLEACRRKLGEAHATTLDAMRTQAHFWAAGGRLAEAQAALETVVQTQRESQGVDSRAHLHALNSLANVYSQQGELERALGVYRVLVARHRKVDGASHPATLVVANNLALTLAQLDRYDEAEHTLRETLDARRETLGAEHPQTLGTACMLAQLLKVQSGFSGERRAVEARELLAATVETCHRALGADHPKTLASKKTLAQLLVDEGELVEARRLLESTLTTERNAWGRSDPRTVGSALLLADCLAAQQEWTTAEQLAGEALQVAQAVDDGGLLEWPCRDVLGSIAAGRGAWTQAASEFEAASQCVPEDDDYSRELCYLHYAPAVVRSGDLSKYEEFCRQLLARYGATKVPRTAERVAKVCVLLPPSDDLWTELTQLQEVVELGQHEWLAEKKEYFRPWGCVVLALIEYRREKWDSSLEWGQRAQDMPSAPEEFREALNLLVMAMAELRLGRISSADQKLARVDRLIEQAYGANGAWRQPEQWFDWAFVEIVREEASQLAGRHAE